MGKCRTYGKNFNPGFEQNIRHPKSIGNIKNAKMAGLYLLYLCNTERILPFRVKL